jgi:hypothetical protein
MAPVNDPFLWPKNLLSKSVFVMALLLTAIEYLQYLRVFLGTLDRDLNVNKPEWFT